MISSPTPPEKCKGWIPFDAEGWLAWDDTYCLNCLKVDCPHKPEKDPKGDRQFDKSSSARQKSPALQSRIRELEQFAEGIYTIGDWHPDSDDPQKMIETAMTMAHDVLHPSRSSSQSQR